MSIIQIIAAASRRKREIISSNFGPAFIAMNVSGLEFGATTVPPTSDLDYLDSIGVSDIRLPFKWDRVQPTLGGAFDETHAGYIDALLDHAQSIGMRVLLDVHSYGVHGTRASNHSGNLSIDGPDGVVTTAHYTDFVTKCAQRWASHAAVWGFDIMNEPNPADMGDDGNTRWPTIAQAAVDAWRAVDSTKKLIIEYWWWSSSWRANDFAFTINDPADNYIVSAHMYHDRDSSGIHYVWDDEVAVGDILDGNAPLTTSIGVKRLTPFLNWCTANGVQPHIGESAVGRDNDAWIDTLSNTLDYCIANGIHFTYFGGVSRWSDGYEYGIKQIGGKQAKQIAPITKNTGAPDPTKFWTVASARRATPNQPFDVRVDYRGNVTSVLNAAVIETLGGAGSFTDPNVSFPLGYNGEQTVTFTPTEENYYTFNTTNGHGYDNNESGLVSTIQDPFAVAGLEPHVALSVYRDNTVISGRGIRLRKESGATKFFPFHESGWIDRQAIAEWAGSPYQILRLDRYTLSGSEAEYLMQNDGNYSIRQPVSHSSQPYSSVGDSRYRPILIMSGPDDEPYILFRYKTRIGIEMGWGGTFTQKSFIAEVFGKDLTKNGTVDANRYFFTKDANDTNIRFLHQNTCQIRDGSHDHSVSLPLTDTQSWGIYGLSFETPATAGMRSYHNGVLVDSTDTTASNIQVDYNTHFGLMGHYEYWGQDHWNGGVKAFYIFNSALTTQQHADIKTAMENRNPCPPIVWTETFDFPENTGPALSTGMLKGVNISGNEGFYNNRYYGFPNLDYTENHNLDHITYFAGKGMNVIRLPFEWHRLQPKLNGALSQYELEKIDRVVRHCRSLGMHVILDPHQVFNKRLDDWQQEYIIGNGNVPISCLTDMWTRLATCYNGNSGVIFHILNEPHQYTATQWRDHALAVIAGIRSVNTTSRIQIPGTSFTGAHSWSSSGNAAAWDEAFDTLGFTDPNFEFEMHQYLDSNHSGTNYACTTGAGASRLVAATNWARARGVKVFLGEVGWTSSASCPAEGTAILQYMEDNNDVWSGWAIWASYQSNPNEQFSLTPVSGVDKPQMAQIEPFL